MLNGPIVVAMRARPFGDEFRPTDFRRHQPCPCHGDIPFEKWWPRSPANHDESLVAGILAGLSATRQ